MSGVQTPSQGPDTGLSPEKCAYKVLRTKHFHGVSYANPHAYSLTSRYGKVMNIRSKRLLENCGMHLIKEAEISDRGNRLFYCIKEVDRYTNITGDL